MEMSMPILAEHSFMLRRFLFTSFRIGFFSASRFEPGGENINSIYLTILSWSLNILRLFLHSTFNAFSMLNFLKILLFLFFL
jgi:hypothetical protein